VLGPPGPFLLICIGVDCSLGLTQNDLQKTMRTYGGSTTAECLIGCSYSVFVSVQC